MGPLDTDYMILLAAEVLTKKQLMREKGRALFYNLTKTIHVPIVYVDTENDMFSMYFNLSKMTVRFMNKFFREELNKFYLETEPIRIKISNAFSSVLEQPKGDYVTYSNFPTEAFIDNLEMDPSIADRGPLIDFWNAMKPYIKDRVNQVKFNNFSTSCAEVWAKECYGYKLFLPLILKYANTMASWSNNEQISKVVKFAFVNYSAMLLLTLNPKIFIVNQMSSVDDVLVYYNYKRVVSGFFHNKIKSFEETIRTHPLEASMTLRGTQPEVLDLLKTQFETKNIALLCADPSFGKTTLSLILSHMMISPRTTQKVMMVMKTSGLVTQWYAQFRNLGLHHYYDHFVWVKSGDIPVSSVVHFDRSNMHNQEKLKDACYRSQFFFVFENRLEDMPPMDVDLLVYDECHQSITSTTGAALANVRSKNILLVSATPGIPITSMLKDFSPNYRELTSKYREFVLEKFDSMFTITNAEPEIEMYSFNLQFIESNIVYNFVLAERIREYVTNYRGVPKVIVFVNSIIHAYLLEWCLVQKGVSTTLYIQSDTQCNGDATVMIGTKNKISTGFDQNNSSVIFNHKFNTAVIAMVVSKFDLFYQMLGRIMRNDVPSEELRLIYAVNSVSNSAYNKILGSSTIQNLHVQGTNSSYGPITMDLRASYDGYVITHGMLPSMNRRVDNELTEVWKSEVECRIDTYDAELQRLKLAYDDDVLLNFDPELIGSCNCKEFNFTTKITDGELLDDGKYNTCQHFCISYLRSIFCYSINLRRNITYSPQFEEQFRQFDFEKMLSILTFEKMSHKHKQIDARTQVKSYFSSANINYLTPGKDKIGFEVISAVTKPARSEKPAQKAAPIVPRNRNARLMDFSSIPILGQFSKPK